MAHTIATVIMIEGELDLKQLAQGCTYAPGNNPSRGSQQCVLSTLLKGTTKNFVAPAGLEPGLPGP